MHIPTLFRPLLAPFLALSLTLFLAAPIQAAEPVQQHNSNAVWFENWTGLSNATLKVVAPDGKITEIFAPNGTPVFQLSGRDVLDGVYRYELNAATDEKETIVNPVDNGRGAAASNSRAKPYAHNGHFIVSRGVIVTPEEIKEEDS